MIRWEYCKVSNKAPAEAFFFDEAGSEQPIKHARFNVLLAKLGHDGWEIVSVRWDGDKPASCILKRQYQGEWTDTDRQSAKEKYHKNYPSDTKY
jgi:hypothetical protein